ncbi:MAG: methylmalonyl Co-A mutase-associated GTPase MeaB [Desulfobacterales bacterium]|nr:methylmalonyl Co-A mutase-associated GTPase MeaB [Desulfobacterales bacterium]
METLNKMETPPPEADALLNGVVRGEARAISRAINMVENRMDGADHLLDAIYEHVGNAHRVGVTGPPGAGKSTFTNQLIKIIRASGRTVGVVAVDPTSPFTGGALFGDRLRMDDIVMDPCVFIRSMATRGSLGGLSGRASEVADILDASGKEVIIFETVGVGQIELDVMSAADTIIVMTVPDAGDVIQGMKAGLMEIGDIFVVNKSDLPGADRMKMDIEMVLQMRETTNAWLPKVWLTDSKAGAGTREIYDNINAHLQFLKDEGVLQVKRSQRAEERIRLLVNEYIKRQFWTEERSRILKDHLKDPELRISPHSAAKKLFGVGVGE